MSDKQVKAGPWLAMLGAKFAWVVPLRTSLVVLLTLFSQISHLLAFLLPLKIVILLGSDGIPRYFPSSFARLDRDLLVVLLALATVGFFLAHVIAERITDRVTKAAAGLLVERNKKLSLFENQDQVAEGAYQGLARALAGLVFCLLVLCALAWLYPEMAMIMGGYIALTAMVTMVFHSRSVNARDWLNANLNVLMGNLSAVGFFTVFGYLVVDFAFLEPPGILVAILSILAGRQVFGRVAAAVGGLCRLYEQREKLDAIFFHGRPLLNVISDKPGSFWQYLAPGQRGEWAAPLLREFCEVDISDPNDLGRVLKWQQPANPDIGVFTYYQDDWVCLLKLFSKKRHIAALHEATLLADAPKGLPAPHFQGASQFGELRCSVYGIAPGAVVRGAQNDSARVTIFSKLLSVEVDKPFARRYLRSMSTLPQRMSLSWLDRLEIATVSTAEKESLDGVRRCWQKLRDFLSTLPLTIYNPSVKPGFVWRAEGSGDYVVLPWERWSLEPAGAGWPIGRMTFDQLLEAQTHARMHRKSLQSCPTEHLMLAALTFALEQHIKSQRLDVGVEIMTRLWQFLENSEAKQALDRSAQ